MTEETVPPSNAPAPPPWIASLPVDSRNFHVPAETPWLDGVPLLSRVGNAWKLALGFLRACAVCGYTLEPNQPVYRAFSQGDAATVRGYEREVANDLSGPGHLSCMLYSAQVCPYLRVPTARLGKTSTIAPGAKRGSLAAVLGFENYVLALPLIGDPYGDNPAHQAYFLYERLLHDHKFRRGEELREVYAQALTNDADHIDLANEQAVWTEESEISSLLSSAHGRINRKSNFERKVRLFDRGFSTFRLPII